LNPDITFLGAFLVGFLGSTHCLGMCGGIVSALTFGLGEDIRRSPWRLFPYLLSYNAGRIASYMLAGAAAGALSAAVFGLAPPDSVKIIVKWMSGGFMIALGLYLAGWWPGLQWLEKWGGVLWKRIEPLGRRLLPVSHPLKALALGLVWGWLPCGMVYAALIWALSSGSAVQGAMLMLAFGLGTLPMLLAVGAAAEGLRNFVRNVWVRRAAGIVVLGLGVAMVLGPAGHANHAANVAHPPAHRD
jgi:hypothetical protein